MMRTKKTIKNTIFSLFEDFIAIICSFILPQLILLKFGSIYNGLTTSITQFLSFAVLLRSGIGGATRAALYKPLAEHNKHDVDAIINATDKYMKKIGIILLFCILVTAVFFPFVSHTNFSWLFVFSLFIIIGISSFAESFFGITYLILLQADQKLYISSIIKIISYIFNIVIASILILSGFSIHIVKLGSAIAFVFYPICLNLYVRKKYKIDKKVEPNYNAISQRWDAFWHQIAFFVNNNTDVVVLTLFTNMLEVSVYSVYHLVTGALNRFITAFTNGVYAGFGNMIAKKENSKLLENLSIIELVFYSISSIIFSCAIILIFQFVNIYTKGVNDVNYIRHLFAYILLLSQFYSCIKLPYQSIVDAAGAFKQTKKYAIWEVIINIFISVILVIKLGLIGVAIGTLVGSLYKTIMFLKFISKNIIIRPEIIGYKKIMLYTISMVLVFLIINSLNLTFKISYISFLINGIIVFVISTIIVFLINIIFYNNDFKLLLHKIKYAMKGR